MFISHSGMCFFFNFSKSVSKSVAWFIFHSKPYLSNYIGMVSVDFCKSESNSLIGQYVNKSRYLWSFMRIRKEQLCKYMLFSVKAGDLDGVSNDTIGPLQVFIWSFRNDMPRSHVICFLLFPVLATSKVRGLEQDVATWYMLGGSCVRENWYRS